MGYDDPYALPNVEISGELALALSEALDYARFRTAPGPAWFELTAVKAALMRDIKDAGGTTQPPGE